MLSLLSSGTGFKHIIWIAESCAQCTKKLSLTYTCFARIHFALVWLGLSRGIFGFPSSTFCQIRLMSLALCVGQIVPFIVVQCQTKLAFITAPHTPSSTHSSFSPIPDFPTLLHQSYADQSSALFCNQADICSESPPQAESLETSCLHFRP